MNFHKYFSLAERFFCLTATRYESVACDEGRFISPEEFLLRRLSQNALAVARAYLRNANTRQSRHTRVKRCVLLRSLRSLRENKIIRVRRITP